MNRLKTLLIAAGLLGLRCLDLATFLLGVGLVAGGLSVVHWPSALVVSGVLILSTVFIPRLVKGKSE